MATQEQIDQLTPATAKQSAYELSRARHDARFTAARLNLAEKRLRVALDALNDMGDCHDFVASPTLMELMRRFRTELLAVGEAPPEQKESEEKDAEAPN